MSRKIKNKPNKLLQMSVLMEWNNLLITGKLLKEKILSTILLESDSTIK